MKIQDPESLKIEVQCVDKESSSPVGNEDKLINTSVAALKSVEKESKLEHSPSRDDTNSRPPTSLLQHQENIATEIVDEPENIFIRRKFISIN